MLKDILKEYYDSVLNETDLYQKSKTLVNFLFKDIKDKEMEPYIGHLERVSNKMSSEEGKIVGLLHDVVEDTKITLEDLKKLGYTDNIIVAVDIVSKRQEEDYDTYIDRVISSGNTIALELKKCDLEDNMDPKRLSKLDKDTKERLEKKYKKAYERIINGLKER